MGHQTKLDSFVFSTSDSPNDSRYISFIKKDQISKPITIPTEDDLGGSSSSSEHSGEEGFTLTDKPVILSPPPRSPVSESSSASLTSTKRPRKLISRSRKRTIRSSTSSESDQDRVGSSSKPSAKFKKPKRTEATARTSVASDESNESAPKIKANRDSKKVERGGKDEKSERVAQSERTAAVTSSPRRPEKLSNSPAPSRQLPKDNSLFGSPPPTQASQSQSQLIIRPPVEEDYDSDLIIVDDSPPTSPVKPSRPAIPTASTSRAQHSPALSQSSTKAPSSSKMKRSNEPLVKPGHSRIIKKSKPIRRKWVGYATASSDDSSSSEEAYKPTAGRMHNKTKQTRVLPSSSEDDSEESEEVPQKKKLVITQRAKPSRTVVSDDDTIATKSEGRENGRSDSKQESRTKRRDIDLGPTSRSVISSTVEKNGKVKKKEPPGVVEQVESPSKIARDSLHTPSKVRSARPEDTLDLFYSSPECEHHSGASDAHASSGFKPRSALEERADSKSPSKHNSATQVEDASLDLEVRLSKAHNSTTGSKTHLDSSSSVPSKPLTTRQRLSMSIVSSDGVALRPAHKSTSDPKRVSSSTQHKTTDNISTADSSSTTKDRSERVGLKDSAEKRPERSEEKRGERRGAIKAKSGRGSGSSKQRMIITSEEEDDNSDKENGSDGGSESDVRSTARKNGKRIDRRPSDSEDEGEIRDDDLDVDDSEVEDLGDDQGKLRIVEARMRSAETRKGKQALARQNALERLKHKKGKRRGSSVHLSSSESSSTDGIDDSKTVWAKTDDGDWLVSGGEEDDGYITDDIEDGDYTSLMPMEFRSDASQPMDQCFHVICQWHIHYIIQGRPFLKLSVNNDYFRIPMLRLREKMTDVKNQVASQIWPSPFNLSLQTYPVFTGGFTKDAPPCAACRMTNRPATRKIILRGDPYNKKTFRTLDGNWGRKGPPDTRYGCLADMVLEGQICSETMCFAQDVGKYCYARANKFHELAHWEYNLHHALQNILQVLRKSVHKDDDDDEEEDEDIEVISHRETVRIAGKVERVDSLPEYNRPDKVTEWLQNRQWIKEEWLHISELLLCNENLNAPWKKTD